MRAVSLSASAGEPNARGFAIDRGGVDERREGALTALRRGELRERLVVGQLVRDQVLGDEPVEQLPEVTGVSYSSTIWAAAR